MARKDETPLATLPPAAEAAPANLALAPAPSYVESSTAGFENVVDLALTRLTLLQQLSPECQERASGLNPGDVIRRNTSEVFYQHGAPPMPFTVAFYFKEYVEFGDRDNPAEPIVKNRSLDHSSPLAEQARQWVKRKLASGREARLVQDIHNFVVLRDGAASDPVTLSLGRSNAKYATGLLNLLATRGPSKPMYAGRFLLSTKLDKNRAGQQYYVFRFQNPAPPDSPWAAEREYRAAAELYAILKDRHGRAALAVPYAAEDAGSDDADAGAPPI